MIKNIFVVVLLFVFSSVSFSFYNAYYSNDVDTCCVLDTFHYDTQHTFIENYVYTHYPYKIIKYNNLLYKVKTTVDRKYKNNKRYIYDKLIDKIVDYAYEHNIEKGTSKFYLLQYFVYKLQFIGYKK